MLECFKQECVSLALVAMGSSLVGVEAGGPFRRVGHLLGRQGWSQGFVTLLWMLGSGSQSLQACLIIIQERNSHFESGSRQA